MNVSLSAAHTPTGTGPALPLYMSDEQERWQDEDARERALCDVDTIADRLLGECIGRTAYRHKGYTYDARALEIDYLHAQHIATPELLALALGLAVNQQARIAAMDELARRAGVPA